MTIHVWQVTPIYPVKQEHEYCVLEITLQDAPLKHGFILHGLVSWDWHWEPVKPPLNNIIWNYIYINYILWMILYFDMYKCILMMY